MSPVIIERRPAIAADNLVVTQTYACGRSGEAYYEIHLAGCQPAQPAIGICQPCRDRSCRCTVVITHNPDVYVTAMRVEGTEAKVSVTYHIEQRDGKRFAVLEVFEVRV